MWPPVGFMKETLSIFDKRFLITPTDKKNAQTRRATSYYYFDNDLQEGGFFKEKFLPRYCLMSSRILGGPPFSW